MFIQMVKFSVLAEGSIIVPVWVISIVIGFLASLLTTWGVLQATKANLEVRAKRNEEDIQNIQKEKVNKSEFQMVYKMLQNIDKKLDEHINQS